MIDRYLPTTKWSPVSLKNIPITLKDRIFIDGDFREDRDVKSAKTILCFALYSPALTRKELMGLSVEELSNMVKEFYSFATSQSCETESHALSGFGDSRESPEATML